MATVKIVNHGVQYLCVLVEPVGNDYWIAPDQSLRFAVPDENPVVSWYEGGASIWIEEGDAFDFDVKEASSGDSVICGYQRPPEAFD